MIFKAKKIQSRQSKFGAKSKQILVWFKYSADQLEIKEEIPILGTTKEFLRSVLVDF